MPFKKIFENEWSIKSPFVSEGAGRQSGFQDKTITDAGVSSPPFSLKKAYI